MMGERCVAHQPFRTPPEKKAVQRFDTNRKDPEKKSSARSLALFEQILESSIMLEPSLLAIERNINKPVIARAPRIRALPLDRCHPENYADLTFLMHALEGLGNVDDL
jgi:hypothetical protein